MKNLVLVLTLVAATSGLALAKGNYADNGATVTHDCAKDPEASVSGNKNTITFTGKCKHIDVAGNENTIVVASTKALAVAGNTNTITADAVDQISALGNDNTITWKKGVAGAKAKVSSLGTNNKINQAK